MFLLNLLADLLGVTRRLRNSNDRLDRALHGRILTMADVTKLNSEISRTSSLVDIAIERFNSPDSDQASIDASTAALAVANARLEDALTDGPSPPPPAPTVTVSSAVREPSPR